MLCSSFIPVLVGPGLALTLGFKQGLGLGLSTLVQRLRSVFRHLRGVGAKGKVKDSVKGFGLDRAQLTDLLETVWRAFGSSPPA